MIITGIILAVLAAAIGTTSKQLIAYSEFTDKRWSFHLGASLNMFVGPIVDGSAYAFAPQVVVAPFACLDVIFNALSAPYTLSWQHERLTEAHIAATLLVATGAVLTAMLGSVHDDTLSVFEIERRLAKPESVAYVCIELLLICGLHLALNLWDLSPKVRGISLGVAAGVLMGNVFCMKGFMCIVRDTMVTGDLVAWSRPTPYVLMLGALVGAILGHLFMRKGLAEYKGIFWVTIFEGAHICAACLSGCVVMQEMAHAPWWQYTMYWLAVGIIVAGMTLINTSAAESHLGKSCCGKRSRLRGSRQESAGLVPKDFSAPGTWYTEPVTYQDGSHRSIDAKASTDTSTPSPSLPSTFGGDSSVASDCSTTEDLLGHERNADVQAACPSTRREGHVSCEV
mmetsp:Transcript_27966/g.80250  ORF Transcript_27966/g.80250 Transcript_27966/m.80250 type:complete len:397 (+) Transcript_27966:117-1307(+)